MKKESYLSEEKYQQSKNKISQIAKTILIIGVCLGAFLIIMGIIKINKNASNQDNNQTEISVVDLKSQVDALEEDLIPLQAQKSTEFKSNGFSELYYRLDKEIKDKKEEISELESQIWKIESGYNDTFNNANNIRTKAGAMPYFMFGGFIIVAEHILQCCFPLDGVKNISQAAKVCMPLAQQLVDGAAFSNLIFQLAAFIIPVFRAIKTITVAFIC